jgi:hypothetical protein
MRYQLSLVVWLNFVLLRDKKGGWVEEVFSFSKSLKITTHPLNAIGILRDNYVLRIVFSVTGEPTDILLSICTETPQRKTAAQNPTFSTPLASGYSLE